MNEQQLLSCKKIFKEVTRRPISRLFWDDPSEITNKKIARPISLRFIYEKLERQLYKSPSDFVTDMHQLFLNGDCYSRENSLKPAAINLLIEDFEKALALYSPSSLSLNIKLCNALNEVSDITTSPVEENIGRLNYKASPACHYLNHYDSNPENVTISELRHQLSLIKSPNLLLPVIQYIHKLQPDAVVIGQGISIVYTAISKENLALIHTYIHKTMSHAAIGSHSGLEISALSEIESTIVQQIDFRAKERPQKRNRRNSYND